MKGLKKIIVKVTKLRNVVVMYSCVFVTNGGLY